MDLVRRIRFAPLAGAENRVLVLVWIPPWNLNEPEVYLRRHLITMRLRGSPLNPIGHLVDCLNVALKVPVCSRFPQPEGSIPVDT